MCVCVVGCVCVCVCVCECVCVCVCVWLSVCLWVLFLFCFGVFLLLNLMFEHDCLDTCCFGCLIRMYFVLLYLHMFSVIEHVSHGILL